MRLSVITILSSLAVAPAFAADLGTYRPGTPYHSVIVPNANVCESQCAGDAQCRGWNYVKAAPQAPGICEFQSQVGTPVASAISISGISATASPLSDRVSSGQTNTIRVGTTVTPQADTQITQSQSGRPIVREAVPTPNMNGIQPRHIATATRTPQPRHLQSALGTPAQPYTAPLSATRRTPTQTPSAYANPQGRVMTAPVTTAPTIQSQLQGRTVPQGHMQAVAPTSSPQMHGRPAIGQPIAPPAWSQAQMPQPQAYAAPMIHSAPQTQAGPRPSTFTPSAQPTPAPIYRAPHIQPQPTMTQPMQRTSVTTPVTWQSAQPSPSQPSLYGHLHDDIRATAPHAPAAQTPNGSMPTISARPAYPVAKTQLAGASPR